MLSSSSLRPQNVKSPPSTRPLDKLRMETSVLNKRPNWDLIQGNDFSSHDELVPKVQNDNDGQIQIGRNKSFSIPVMMGESFPATSKEQDNEHHQSDPGAIRLERTSPRELLMTINTLSPASVVEVEIGDADTDPIDQGGN